ncbi:hypothetical protein [Sphingomonas sp. PAMC 26621]|uniref:hypothetical protein n=1 Tax=Sphingomonas sp. PAMC 26621 TaxID=1112213 RepID=UPI000289935B|nr:hypothetical protein [Sphingomonas sp. PAMC 26621]
MNRTATALCLLLAACSPGGGFGNDAGLYDTNTTAPAPGVQPVQIGEGGSAFQACAGLGEVVNLSPGGEAYLPLRAAPFAEADEVARLGAGTRVFRCTRSLDQRWQGVVVVPADGSECGVAAPIAAPRPYAGPCKSGWALTGFIRPIAG